MPSSQSRFRLVSGLAVFSFLLAACSPSTAGIATLTPVLTSNTQTPIPSPTASPTATPVPILPVPQYQFNLALDYAEKTVSVAQTIHYSNRSGEAIPVFVLAAEPNLFPGCFTLKRLLVNEQEVEYTLKGHRLEIPLPALLQPGGTVEIFIQYTLVMPHIEPDSSALYIRGQIFGYTYQQLNLVDWYLIVLPYQPGTGWLLNDQNYYGEYMVYESADFDLTVNLADPVNPPVIAASGQETASGSGRRFILENGRTFALSFSREFALDQTSVDGVTIYSYYFPYFKVAGQAALDVVARALHVFGEHIAPYPHPTLSIVQIETAFAMEYDGFFFMDTPIYGSYTGAEYDFLPVTAAHETAHQWWFALVGNDQANQPWLDEALATYSERLYYEWTAPERVVWWTAARLGNMAESNCFVDISIYGFYGYDCYYTPSVYLRGAIFLNDLRTRVGDEVFFAFLKDYAVTYSQQVATTQGFFDLLRQHTQTDYSDILAEYFQNSH